MFVFMDRSRTGRAFLCAATFLIFAAPAQASSVSVSASTNLAVPKVNGLSCPFQLGDDSQKLHNQLNLFLQEASHQFGKSSECSGTQQRIQELASELQSDGASQSDPAYRTDQEILAENMTFALTSHCTSALADPAPVLYTSLFVANDLTQNQALLGTADASIMLMTEIGKQIMHWLKKPPKTQRVMTADQKQQDFLNRLCILYVYDHQVDNMLEQEKQLGPRIEKQTELKKQKLANIEKELNDPKFCVITNASSNSVKAQLRALQATVSKLSPEADLAAQCGQIRRTFDRGSSDFRTLDSIAGSCRYDDANACAVHDDGKISLEKADFCHAWCRLKAQNLKVSFSCDGDSRRQTAALAEMRNRVRTALNYVLQQKIPTLDQDLLSQYKQLLNEKAQLEGAGVSPDPSALKKARVLTDASEPRLRAKIDALSQSILGAQLHQYVQSLAKMNQDELKRLEDDLKHVSKLKKKTQDPSFCPAVQEASASLHVVRERLAHLRDVCTYFGQDKTAVAFHDPSLSFWDESADLRKFCLDLPKTESKQLSDKDGQRFDARIRQAGSSGSCKQI